MEFSADRHVPQRMKQKYVEVSPAYLSALTAGQSSSARQQQHNIHCIDSKHFGTDIRAPLRMNPSNFKWSQPFPLDHEVHVFGFE